MGSPSLGTAPWLHVFQARGRLEDRRASLGTHVVKTRKVSLPGRRSALAHGEMAERLNADLVPFMRELREQGRSMRDITRVLTSRATRHVLTPRGARRKSPFFGIARLVAFTRGKKISRVALDRHESGRVGRSVAIRGGRADQREIQVCVSRARLTTMDGLVEEGRTATGRATRGRRGSEGVDDAAPLLQTLIDVLRRECVTTHVVRGPVGAHRALNEPEMSLLEHCKPNQGVLLLAWSCVHEAPPRYARQTAA